MDEIVQMILQRVNSTPDGELCCAVGLDAMDGNAVLDS